MFGRNKRITDPAEVLPHYIEWLKGYFARGGSPTHYYDMPFAKAHFEYQRGGHIQVDSERDFGIRGRSIVVGKGASVDRTDPNDAHGGWAHVDVYAMDGYQRLSSSIVPIYSDPEFDAVLTDEQRGAQAASKLEAQYLFEEGDMFLDEPESVDLPDVAPAGGLDPDRDDAALRALSGATFGGDVILPSGERLDAQTAQAWSAAFEATDPPAGEALTSGTRAEGTEPPARRHQPPSDRGQGRQQT